MSLNNSAITQSVGVPYQQYVTSSAGHTFVSSSTYFNDTSDNIPRYKGPDDRIYDVIISSSYALTASHALNGGNTNTPTLDEVTTAGNTTNNSIKVNSLTSTAKGGISASWGVASQNVAIEDNVVLTSNLYNMDTVDI